MSGVISISEEVWQQRLARLMQELGIEFREALYAEWPLLIRKVMDFTPPFKAKGQRGLSDLAVGRAAVAYDIYKVMKPFNPATRTKALERIVERKDIAAFNALAARSTNPYMAGKTAVAFDPTLHLSARNARGRVEGRDRGRYVLGSDVGLLKQYVAKVQNRVGYAKSGWLKALLLVGGEAPGYVSKQGTGGGDVIDDHANPDFPSITAINRTPWAVRKDEGDRILTDAYASRATALDTRIRVAIRLADQKSKAA